MKLVHRVLTLLSLFFFGSSVIINFRRAVLRIIAEPTRPTSTPPFYVMWKHQDTATAASISPAPACRRLQYPVPGEAAGDRQHAG